MGQYYKIVNLDKKEYLHPHKFGDGFKLMEFGLSACGTMTGLALLLACSNGRGGGDFPADDPLIGSWSGCRISVIGDYAEPGDPGVTEDDIRGAWGSPDDNWTANSVDISEQVVELMRKDSFLKADMRKAWV